MVVGANSSHWCWVLFDCSAAENMCGCHWFAVVPVLGQLSVVLSCGFYCWLSSGGCVWLVVWVELLGRMTLSCPGDWDLLVHRALFGILFVRVECDCPALNLVGADACYAKSIVRLRLARWGIWFVSRTLRLWWFVGLRWCHEPMLVWCGHSIFVSTQGAPVVVWCCVSVRRRDRVDTLS